MASRGPGAELASQTQVNVLNGAKVIMTGTVTTALREDGVAALDAAALDFQVARTDRPIPPGLRWWPLRVSRGSSHVQPLAKSLLGNGTRPPKFILGGRIGGLATHLAAGFVGGQGPELQPTSHDDTPLCLWLGVVEQRMVPRQSRKRQRSESPDAAPSTSSVVSGACTPGDVCEDASPAVAVLRDTAFTAACMALANKLVPHRPYSSETKTGRSMRKGSTLEGVQGIVARWVFGAFLQPPSVRCFDADSFLPVIPPAGHTPDGGVVKEFQRLGLSRDHAERAEKCLASALHSAAMLVSGFREKATLPAGWTDDTAGVYAVGPAGIQLACPGAVALKAAASQTVLAAGETEGCVRLVWKAPAPLPTLACAGLPLHMVKPFQLISSASPGDEPGGRRWSGTLPYAQPEDAELFTLPSEVTLQLRKSHYTKLQTLYARAATRNASNGGEPLDVAGQRMHTRMFNCLARYETLSGNSSGFQGAVTHAVLDTLTEELGATVEGFASPLNCYYSKFCSLFPDVDRHFGSLGSFFAQPLHEGCFEVNPPFVNATLNTAWAKMRDALEASDAAAPRSRAAGAPRAQPLQFIFITPGWADAVWAVEASASPYCSARLQPGLGAHEYRDGTQWRSQRLVWSANTTSFYFLLQNEAAKEQWPVTPERLDALRSRLQTSVAGRAVPLLQPQSAALPGSPSGQR